MKFFNIILFLTVGMLASCAGPHKIMYQLDTLDDARVKFNTRILVRALIDRRPVNQRKEPRDIGNATFYLGDKHFAEPVDQAISRCLRLELANAGIEVVDPANQIPGNPTNVRVDGDILDFHVTRAPAPSGLSPVLSVWKNERFTFKVRIRIEMIDTRQHKSIMEKEYSYSDSIVLRSEMMDVQNSTRSNTKTWETAGEELAIQYLNNALKVVMTSIRQDIVQQITPNAPVPIGTQNY